MAPETFSRWVRRVDGAASLAALEGMATELRQLPEEDAQAQLFLLCTLRRVGLYHARARRRYAGGPPCTAAPAAAVNGGPESRLLARRSRRRCGDQPRPPA